MHVLHPTRSPAERIAPAPSFDQEIDEGANLRRTQTGRLVKRVERRRRRLVLAQETLQAPLGKLPFHLP